jgi:[acyl-carrier-protein] S-malonyltransferase
MTAFLFPGQLSESVGIGRDFYDSDPEARELFAMTSRRCGRNMEKLLFEGPETLLHENLAAQAGVYLVSTLCCRALEREGIPVAAAAGYSLGNYAGLAAAAAISYEEGLEVLVAVWRETERLRIVGSMGAVIGVRPEAAEQVCGRLRAEGKPVWIGNVNASTQFVLTGQTEAVQAALEELRPRSLSVMPLSMSWPIHSPMMTPVAEAIAPVVRSLRSIRDPRVPYYLPDGSVARTGAQVRRLLGTGFCHPTLWKNTFEAMVADGFRVFLEVGPGELLSKTARWIDRSVTCLPAGSLTAIRRAADIVRASR